MSASVAGRSASVWRSSTSQPSSTTSSTTAAMSAASASRIASAVCPPPCWVVVYGCRPSVTTAGAVPTADRQLINGVYAGCSRALAPESSPVTSPANTAFTQSMIGSAERKLTCSLVSVPSWAPKRSRARRYRPMSARRKR